jgi:hypothetical protein
MAECKICGAEYPSLPEYWTNWVCPLCAHEILNETVGVHSPKERRACREHASAEGEVYEEGGIWL